MIELDFFDILIILAKNKKKLFKINLLVSVLVIVYVLVVPQKWGAKATLKSVSNSESGISLAAAGLDLGSFLGASSTEGTDLLTIMQSRTFSEQIINKFDLVKYMKIKFTDPDKKMEAAVKRFKQKIFSISMDEENNLITIYVETKDKNLSAEIANYACYLLDDYNKNVKMTKGKENRIFIEKRLAEIKAKQDSLNNDFLSFQQKYNTIQLDVQTTQALSFYSNLIAQMKQAEIELEYNEKIYSPNAEILKTLKDKLNVLTAKVKQSEKSGDASKYLIAIDKLPDLQKEYAELYLQIQLLQKVYEFLYPQLESARLEELKDLPTIEIIDKAVPLGFRAWPKRAKTCIMVFFASLIISSSVIVYKNIISKETLQKMKQLKKEIL